MPISEGLTQDGSIPIRTPIAWGRVPGEIVDLLHELWSAGFGPVAWSVLNGWALVFLDVAPAELVREADRLQTLRTEIHLSIVDAMVSATYDPRRHTAALSLSGRVA